MRKRKREREKGEQESKRGEREELTGIWRRRRMENGKERGNRSGFVGRVLKKLEINKDIKSKLLFLDSITTLGREKLPVRIRLLTLRERSSCEGRRRSDKRRGRRRRDIEKGRK